METNYARIIERRCQEKIIMKESKILIHKHSENCLVGARNEKKKKKIWWKRSPVFKFLRLEVETTSYISYWRIGGKRKEFIENSMINKNLLSICRIKKFHQLKREGKKGRNGRGKQKRKWLTTYRLAINIIKGSHVVLI